MVELHLPGARRRPRLFPGCQQLVDFGLGVKFSQEDEKFREDVGSLYYVAPEVLGRNYTKVLQYSVRGCSRVLV